MLDRKLKCVVEGWKLLKDGRLEVAASTAKPVIEDAEAGTAGRGGKDLRRQGKSEQDPESRQN